MMTFYLVVVLAVVLLIIWKDNLQYRVNMVPSGDIRVSELYELENGDWIENEEGRMVPDESSIAITHSCTSIYYKGNNKEDRLPVWEAGQKLSGLKTDRQSSRTDV